MIVKVANRGWSLKGAGKYYLHDKRDREGKTRSTSDRVGFIYTNNLPNDGRSLTPEEAKKALNLMAYTAMHADVLKEQAGVSKRGRKVELGSVYSYSLSWDREQTPDDEEMRTAAISSIQSLGLYEEYHSLIVQHKDTEHPHVHIIASLISPENGKVANVGNDHVKFSKWAEQYEREHGGIIIDKRVENNQQRDEATKEQEQRKADRQSHSKGDKTVKPDTGIVKHRESKIDKEEIQNLYLSSSTGAAFSAGLEAMGYSLAKGDRRGVVLVNMTTGKTHSLSRQISGLWKRDDVEQNWKGGLQHRFEDFDAKVLLTVEQTRLANEKRMAQQIYRDDYEADRQIKLEDAAHQEGRGKKAIDTGDEVRTPAKEKDQAFSLQTLALDKQEEDNYFLPEPFYEQYDRLKAISDKADQERLAAELRLKEFYKLDERKKDLSDLERQRERLKLHQKLLGKEQELSEQIEAHKLSISNAAQRMKEAQDAVNKRLEKQVENDLSEQTSNDNDLKKSLVVDFEKVRAAKEQEQKEADKKRAKEAFKEQERLRRQQEQAERNKELDKGLDYD